MREFCRKQGYRETCTGHMRYVKVLPDRSTSGTMVSTGPDGDAVPAQRWRLVWKHQLRLANEDEFWTGLRRGAVRYAIPVPPEHPEPLPSCLRRFLRDVLHHSDAAIAARTREDAHQR